MKCMEVKENLDAFADDEIDSPKQEKVESHLKTCPNCQAELEVLQAVSKSIKQTLPIVAPAFLDTKVMTAFQDHHATKQTVETEEKVGWFGIPKLAFATAILLLVLFSGFAFQLGRMSVGDVENASSVNVEIDQKNDGENKQTGLTKNDANNETETESVVTKIVEVPVIKEKIIEIPVIKEKVVTKTVYVNKPQIKKSKRLANVSKKNDFAINNSVKDGEVLTQTNLKGFEPVAEIKPKITKKEK